LGTGLGEQVRQMRTGGAQHGRGREGSASGQGRDPGVLEDAADREQRRPTAVLEDATEDRCSRGRGPGAKDMHGRNRRQRGFAAESESIGGRKNWIGIKHELRVRERDKT
jgi:hypothetical protein